MIHNWLEDHPERFGYQTAVMGLCRVRVRRIYSGKMARPAGFEPATLGLEAVDYPCCPLSYPVIACSGYGPFSRSGVAPESY